MIVIPEFVFDAEANGYLSDTIVIDRNITVMLELAARAPVVVLKQEPDGQYANYGQSPEQSDNYRFTVRANELTTIKLATPVEVRMCRIA